MNKVCVGGGGETLIELNVIYCPNQAATSHKFSISSLF